VQGVEEGTWALDRLASGVWPPEDLGAMSAAELCPRAGQAERDEVRRRLDQKVCEKTSALFACPRCHKRNHTYRQVQIGSGDEPSTFMCTCKECGNNYEGYA
jgi:DNA-directed RNA polymerase subunit M/transcription elongation factor TFIIS